MENIKTAFGFSRRIGNTRYRANVYQAPEATESFEDKIMRLIQRETLDIFGNCGIMTVPQTNRQSERSQYGYQAG